MFGYFGAVVSKRKQEDATAEFIEWEVGPLHQPTKAIVTTPAAGSALLSRRRSNREGPAVDRCHLCQDLSNLPGSCCHRRPSKNHLEYRYPFS